MMNEHEIRVCKRVLRHLKKSTEADTATAVPAVYTRRLPPAEQLRKQADEIEDRDADIDAFLKMIHTAQAHLEIREKEST